MCGKAYHGYQRLGAPCAKLSGRVVQDVSNGYAMAMMTMIAIAMVLVAVDDDDGDECSDDGNACHFSV